MAMLTKTITFPLRNELSTQLVIKKEPSFPSSLFTQGNLLQRGDLNLDNSEVSFCMNPSRQEKKGDYLG